MLKAGHANSLKAPFPGTAQQQKPERPTQEAQGMFHENLESFLSPRGHEPTRL